MECDWWGCKVHLSTKEMLVQKVFSPRGCIKLLPKKSTVSEGDQTVDLGIGNGQEKPSESSSRHSYFMPYYKVLQDKESEDAYIEINALHPTQMTTSKSCMNCKPSWWSIFQCYMFRQIKLHIASCIPFHFHQYRISCWSTLHSETCQTEISGNVSLVATWSHAAWNINLNLKAVL